MNANSMDGAQIGFGPWRSNPRKSSAVEFSGATFKSRSVQILCIALLQIPLQIDISIRISNLILYNSSEFSEMN